MTRKRVNIASIGEIGRHYGKVDLDRVGFFDDQPAAPFDKYINAAPTVRSDFKGKQLLSGHANDFFDKIFKRIFDGEALKPATHTKKAVEAGTSGRVMLPPSPSKLHSTPNDWFGCIGKPPVYFSPEVKKPKEIEGKIRTTNVGGGPPNFKIKPNPLGGPGYVDICLNPYPKYSSEPYDFRDKNKKGSKVEGSSTKSKFLTASAPLDYFTPNPYVEPNPGPTYVRPALNERFNTTNAEASGRFYVPFPKAQGGQHAGCFSKFPEYISDLYQDQKRESKLSKPVGSKFVGGGPNSRSKYTTGIVNHVTGISCNVKNYRQYRERVYPLSH